MNENIEKTSPMNAKILLLAIFLIFAAGSVLRFWNLGDASLNETEAFTLATASQQKRTLREIFFNGGDKFLPTPLFFPLVAGNYTNENSSELAVRLPGAILSVVSLLLFFLACRQIAGTGPAALTLLFLSFSPYLIQFNRTFTHYSLVFFLMAAALWTCIRAINSEKPMLWCVICGWSLILCMVFFPVALCLLIPLNIIFFMFGPRDSRTKIVWTTLNVVALCAGFYFLIRWMPALLEKPKYSLIIKEMVDPRFIPAPQFLLFRFLELYFQVFGGAADFFALDSSRPNWFLIPAFFLLPLVFHKAFFHGFKPFPGDEKQRTILFLLIAFTFPVAAVLLFMGLPLGEALLPLLPAFPLVLSIGFFRNPNRGFKLLFAATLFLTIAGSVPGVFRAEKQRIPWRDAVAYLEKNSDPYDAIVILDGWISAPFFHYATPDLKMRAHAFFPDFATRIIGDHFMQDDIARPFRPMFDTNPPFTIESLLQTHDAVWIVYIKKPTDDLPRIEQSTYWLMDNAMTLEHKYFTGKLRVERVRLNPYTPEDPYSVRPPGTF